MANMANIVVYDDATTPVAYTFVPQEAMPNPLWVEQSSTKSKNAKARISQSRATQKNGYDRRLHKVELPIMEQPTGGTSSGFVAPPEIAHTVTLQLSGFIHPRATNTDVANAAKMLINSFLGIATAGTGDEYKNASDVGRSFIVKDILPG